MLSNSFAFKPCYSCVRLSVSRLARRLNKVACVDSDVDRGL